MAKQDASQVFGITRSTSPAAKFVYPKFGGTSESYGMLMDDVALRIEKAEFRSQESECEI